MIVGQRFTPSPERFFSLLEQEDCRGILDLLRRFPDVNVNKPHHTDGRLPLGIAARKGNMEIVNILLEANANPDLVTEASTAFSLGGSIVGGRGFKATTPLLDAIENKKHDIVRLFLNRRADPNQRASTRSWFWPIVLRGAAQGLREPSTTSGVQLRYDRLGVPRTPLSVAIFNRDLLCIQLLLNAGADPNNQFDPECREARTAIELARCLGYPEVIDFLENPGKTATDYNVEGNNYFAMGEYAIAIQNYTYAIAKSDQDATSYANRALARYCLNIEDIGAGQDYDRALHLDPNIATQYVPDNQVILQKIRGAWYNGEGNDNYQAGRHADAIQSYTHAIEQNNQEPSFYINRALARYRINTEDLAAADDYNQALRLDPNVTENCSDDQKNTLRRICGFWHNYQGNTHYAEGRYVDAVQSYTYAIEQNNQEPSFYINRALARYRINTEDSAAGDDYNQALRLDPNVVMRFYAAHQNTLHIIHTNNRCNFFSRKRRRDNQEPETFERNAKKQCICVIS